MVFTGVSSDSKSHQVSWIFLSNLADLNNAAVWMVSIRLPIFNSSSPLSKSLGNVQNPLISITLTLKFHSFFSSLARFKYLSFFFFFSFSWIFTLYSAGTVKYTRRQVLCLLLLITRSGLLARIKWSISISKSQRIICIWFWFVHILFGSMVKLKFLA